MVLGRLMGKTYGEIGEELGRSPHTVRNVLRSAYGRELYTESLKNLREHIMHRLTMLGPRALESWQRQLELADEGNPANHKPARDILTHSGVLQVPSPKRERKIEYKVQFGSDVSVEADVVEEHDPAPQLPALLDEQTTT